MMNEVETKNDVSKECSASLWKSFWFVCIPIAAIYQLLWGVFFRYAPEHIWLDNTFHQIIAGKFASELVIYSLMLWFLLVRTQAKLPASKVLTGLTMGLVLGYTIIGLYQKLAILWPI